MMEVQTKLNTALNTMTTIMKELIYTLGKTGHHVEYLHT